VPVSHALRCIFVHIPRTGGTSIELALGMHGDWRVENTESMFGMIASPQIKRHVASTAFLQHTTAIELSGLLPGEFQNYFRFAFVRNPWDRLVSVYSRMDPHMQATAEKVGLALAGTSFHEFIKRTENFQHVHLDPQEGFVFDHAGYCLVDFVGRYERLVEDFATICSRLGKNIELPHCNVSTRNAYRQYYNNATRKIVERRYGEDIEKFGYRF
jgi:chondroitin 4-sulfotransferase 11